MRETNLMRGSVILLLLIVVSTAVQANPVSRSEALLKARQFMPTRQFAEGRSWRRVKGEASEHPFYVFNDEKGRGFVIVSGDDRTLPILGYADSGALNADSLPVNLRCWLEGYAEQIASLDEGAAATSALMVAEEKPAIAPLITTTWNQSLPYSLMTPTYIDGKGNESHYVTGCVATALAQVMNFHQWPLNCPAIPGYTTGTKKIVMPELPPTTFEWNLMKDHYKSQDRGASADAVAKLMLYVGQANSMDYKQGGSSAYIHLDVMAELFSYSKNAWRARREDYTAVEWEKLIYRELAANRPVLYDGASDVVGHQFVCDGYDGEGFFHINWGWGGSSDGYFVLSLANPDEKGIGGGSGTAGYVFRQTAIIGFQPASEGEEALPVINASTINMKAATYERTSLTSDFANVSTEGCYLQVNYNCVPTTTCDIEAGWAVYEDGTLGNVVASSQITIDCRNLEVGRFAYYYGPKTLSFGAGLADGNYRLMPVYRYLGDRDWTIVSMTDCIYAEIAGNTLSVRGYRIGASYTVNSIDYSGEMAEGNEVKVTINVTNTSDAIEQTAYFWLLKDGEWVMMGKGVGLVDAGETGNINLTFTPQFSGTFPVKITPDAEGSQVAGTSEISISAVRQTTVGGLLFACNLGTKEAKLLQGDYKKYEWGVIEIPSSVSLDGTDYAVTKIDERAFWNVTSLQGIVLPEGLLAVGERAFQFCYELREVQLPSTLKTIGDYAFNGCSSLRSVASRMESPVAISRNVFTYNEWVNDSTQVEAFTKATLYVPEGAKANYQSAPAWSEFRNIYQGEYREAALDGIIYGYPTGESIATIVGCDAEFLRDKDVVIPSAVEIEGKQRYVKAISESAFFQCCMRSLTFEPGIEEIGSSAFWNSNLLETLVLPEGLKTIGERAFESCYDLSEVQLPSTLEALGDYAFNNCPSLNSVVSRMESPVAISRNVFIYNEWINDSTWAEVFTRATLYVPEGFKVKYQEADVWKEFSTISEFDPTSIPQVVANEKTPRIFDLSGRRLNRPRKGLLIINGKKVLIN